MQKTANRIVLPLSEVTFEMMCLLAQTNDIVEWKLPKHETARMIPLLSRPQRAAIALWGWVALLLVPLGFFAAFMTTNWLWFLLLPAAAVVWRANRHSVSQFFLKHLQRDPAVYEQAAHWPKPVLIVLPAPLNT